MLEINQIHQGDSAVLLKQIDDNSIDLTVTSPPYDNLRDYKGYSFDFETIAKELYRVTKEGGIVVWIIGDSTVDGSESGSSFKQALFFMECGFNLHDTMIYGKNAMPFPESNRYNQCFEYMFILSKGKPNTFNALREKTVHKKRSWSSTRNADGSMSRMKYEMGKEDRNRFNVWFYNVGYMQSTKEKYSFEHPAMFPEDLAKDHILSWSNQGDLILDPFAGSGTTLKMAKLQGRKFIGLEISEDYCKIAEKRVRQQSLLSLAEQQEGGAIPPINKLMGILDTFL